MKVNSNFQGIELFVINKWEVSFLFWRIVFDKEKIILRCFPKYVFPYLGISWNDYKGIWFGFWNKLFFLGWYKNYFQLSKSKINKDGYIEMLFVCKKKR